MIGIIEPPFEATDPGIDMAEAAEHLRHFVPLRCDSVGEPWHPLAEVPVARSYEDAVVACVDYAVGLGRRLHDRARVLRALCEHPSFQFHDVAIDSDMIRVQVQVVARGIGEISANLERLLDPPDPTDRVFIEGRRLSADEHGVLTRFEQSSREAELDELPAWLRTPGEALGALFTRVLVYVQERHGYKLSVNDIDQTIAALVEMRARTAKPEPKPEPKPESKPEPEPEPEPESQD